MENSPSFERFKELDLSREEIDRLGEALKKEEFRKLLMDYVKEVQDPENQLLYEKEITELEKERGNDITFLHPTPCYVIKTTLDGDKKCFINICGNDLVKKPSSSPSEKEGKRGLEWSLPHSLSPPSEDLDNKGERCKVFDVLFHPDTLHLAQKNNAFRDMVNSTACNAIETHFDVELDENNLRFPKLKYKGMARASVIRKPSSEGPVERSPEEKEFYDKLYAQADECTQSYKIPKQRKSKRNKKTQDPKSPYTTPKFFIKHRRHIEMEEFTEHKESKLNTTIPQELIIEIDLPLLKSADDIILDVTEKTVQLISEKPAKYKLDLTLPYRVGKDAGNAKFDKALGKLWITLPVQKKSIFVRRDSAKEDSGVESDHSSPVSPESEEENIEKAIIVNDECESKHLVKSDELFRTKFLEDDIQYSLPEFTSHVFDDTIAFTLHVKKVDSESLKKLIDEDEKTVHVKFMSISPSFYQVHYAFMLKLPVNAIQKDSVSIEVWDNNVILKVPFDNCDNECSWYMYGTSQNELQKKFVEEPHILNAIHKQQFSSKSDDKGSQEEKNHDTEDEGITKSVKTRKISSSVEDNSFKENSEGGTNYGSYYESSGDEFSSSMSPCRGRGILKRSSARKMFSRSISESSLDDCMGSLDREGLDIPIPENNEQESEMSTSLKKTVRFNDVVSKQLYRFNSSILGQRKKNQKKAQKKKKAHDKRHSESEASEVEEKKEKFLKTQNDCDLNSEKSSKRDENIFQMDM